MKTILDTLAEFLLHQSWQITIVVGVGLVAG
jgi:hypothetical protein